MINQSHSLTVFNFMWFSWGRDHSFWKLAEHLVDHLNHLLSKENIHQQSSKQGKNGDVVLSSVRVWNKTQPFHKYEKFCHCWRIESTGSWISLIEVKPDSHKIHSSQHTSPDECLYADSGGLPTHNDTRAQGKLLARSPCFLQRENSVLCCILKVWDSGSQVSLLYQDFPQELCCTCPQLA